jgi:hypothetical protein
MSQNAQLRPGIKHTVQLDGDTQIDLYQMGWPFPQYASATPVASDSDSSDGLTFKVTLWTDTNESMNFEVNLAHDAWGDAIDTLLAYANTPMLAIALHNADLSKDSGAKIVGMMFASTTTFVPLALDKLQETREGRES